MEALVAAIVALAGAAIAFAIWQRGRMKRIQDKAEIYNRYMDQRQAVLTRDPDVATPDFNRRADETVRDLGPVFDPRVSGWKRLELIEPRLRAFVTSAVDPAVEDPMDLEMFAEAILHVECGGFRGITPAEWFEAAKSFVGNAASFRALPPPTGKGMDPEAAFADATEVGRRFFGAFGSRSWDRARGIPVG